MSIFTLNDKSKLVEESKALLGRSDAIFNPNVHFVTKKSFNELNLSGLNEIIFGMGCFWGAEKYFWDIPGVNILPLDMQLVLLQMQHTKKYALD